MDHSAWLIEAPGQRYLEVRVIAMLHEFKWTTDHNAAIQFQSKQQAELVMYALRDLKRELFAFDTTLGMASAIEHRWVTTDKAQAMTDDKQTARQVLAGTWMAIDQRDALADHIATALSAARIEGRNEGLEMAAKWHDGQIQEIHDLAETDPFLATEREFDLPRHKASAAAIRALKESK